MCVWGHDKFEKSYAIFVVPVLFFGNCWGFFFIIFFLWGGKVFLLLLLLLNPLPTTKKVNGNEKSNKYIVMKWQCIFCVIIVVVCSFLWICFFLVISFECPAVLYICLYHWAEAYLIDKG